MKKLLTLFVFLFAFTGIAQIVTIPDINFKTALLNHDPVIDINNDGEIQVTEAHATVELSVRNQGIDDLTGIEDFINLIELSCLGNNLQVINTNTLSLLEIFSCGFNNLQSLDISQNSSLRWFFCNHNPMSTLDITNNPNLTRVSFNNTPLSEIDFQSNQSLELIRINFTNLQSIDVTNITSLITLDVSNTNITTVDLTQNSNLRSYAGTNLAMNTINVQGNAILQDLDISGTNIAELDMSNNLGLKRLNITETGIGMLDLTNHSNIQMLSLFDTEIESLDLSNNTSLCYVEGGDSDYLKYVNLRNGNNTLLDPNLSCTVSTTHKGYSTSAQAVFLSADYLDFICVDDIDFSEQNWTIIPANTSFTEDCILGTNNFDPSSIILYPNPATKVLNIQSETVITSIEIINVLGQSLMSIRGTSNKEQLNVSNMSSGNYFVKINTAGSSSVYQIIKE